MWPIIAGAGLIALLVQIFSDDKSKKSSKKPRGLKRIFISFAIEDEIYRDYLVEQAKKERSPFSFVDMSVKHPWAEEEWKKRCRTKIKRCDGMIVLLSKNTYHSSGARWEIKCAINEGVPVIGMHIKKNDIRVIPPELKGKPIITWTWDNLSKSINRMKKYN